MTIFEIIINFTLVIVCFVMGAFFLVFRNYNSTSNANYKISLQTLSFAYFALGVLNALSLVFDVENYTPEFFPFLITLISSLQALLFTVTLVALLNPHIEVRKNLTMNSIPVFGFSFAYLLSLYLFKDVPISNLDELFRNLSNPTVIIRILFFLFYCFQLIYFTKLFLKNEKIYKKTIENYFSETEKLQLHWVRIAFFSALSIGCIVLTSQIFPYKAYNLLTSTLVTLYYFLFAVNYLNYNKLYLKIGQVFEPHEPEMIPNPDSLPQNSRWESLKCTIIVNKLYLKEGITLEELSKQLFIARTTLSNLINTEEGVNFNTWINNLRIEEAKHFFLQNPDYSIFQVSQLTGFSEQSNFSRQFKLITGKTPSFWKKENARQ